MMVFWNRWNKNMKGKVCEIQNLHKSVREGVMVDCEVKIPFFFSLQVLSCAYLSDFICHIGIQITIV